MNSRPASDPLVVAFERGETDPAAFRHADHVHVAWLLLREAQFAEALPRFVAGLRSLAERAGKPGLYHETITWTYLLLINERMRRAGAPDDWEDFAAANPDLLGPHKQLMGRYYSEETLSSDLARRVFVFPEGRVEKPGMS